MNDEKCRLTWQQIEQLYKIGKQPCGEFKKIEDPEDPSLVWENCCFYCGSDAYVSWCDNCMDHHHENGEETCYCHLVWAESHE